MNRDERLDGHQKFKELAALAQRGALSDAERLDLGRHLQQCAACRQVHDEYALLSAEGMNFLATVLGDNRELDYWDDRSTRYQLFERVRRAEQPGAENQSRERRTDSAGSNLLRMGGRFAPANQTRRWAVAAAAAACVLLTVALGAYQLGSSARLINPPAPHSAAMQWQNLSSAKQASDELIALQNERLSRLQAQSSSSQQEVVRLRDALHAADVRVAALSIANAQQSEQSRQIAEQRDKLAGQLRDAQQSYQLAQAELTSLRAERDRVLLRTTSLESRIEELTASSHDQERKLKDTEQYLASDRDIRELMGARKLYIADVFDVDSGSRTRKPFGRVFYTQSKSLIFYAFDLDRQPGVKNASAFQVWGQRDVESGVQAHATNLGILYMDSESNRRWVLRLDDPRQLAEIDAVFVTVEPHGGSQKPTGKPFLYALLRKEANHP